MQNQNWKSPFLKLKDKLRPLYDANQEVYHGVLMAPFHEPGELEDVIGNMEPVVEGEPLLCEIDTPTEACQHHAHYFFGDNACFQQLGRSLNGVEDWIQKIPGNLIPEFHIPKLNNQTHENLVRWANLVYYIAWELDAPYLQAMVEYQAKVDDVGLFPWEEWPQPSGCDPRPWLIHQGDPTNRIEEWLVKFSEDDLWMPDIIDAYLIGDPMISEFITCSLAAIDGLVYILEQVRRNEHEAAREYKKPIRKRRSKSSKVNTELKLLKSFLHHYHFPGNPDLNVIKPLTGNQIAIEMGWFSPAGNPLQSKVSRHMTEIFGENAMSKYNSTFLGDLLKGFIKSEDGGLRDIEVIGEDDSDND